MGGGGLSNVSVRKRRVQHEDDQPCKHEYLIHGKRISDQTVSFTIEQFFRGFTDARKRRDFRLTSLSPGGPDFLVFAIIWVN